MNNRAIIFIKTNLELLFWLTAILLLYFLPENGTTSSLCPFHWMGFKYCPGCGIGRSIHYAMHFNFSASFHYHPLGIFGLAIILLRIKQLLFKPKQSIYEHK